MQKYHIITNKPKKQLTLKKENQKDVLIKESQKNRRFCVCLINANIRQIERKLSWFLGDNRIFAKFGNNSKVKNSKN